MRSTRQSLAAILLCCLISFVVWGCSDPPDPAPIEEEEAAGMIADTPVPTSSPTPFPETPTPTLTPTITPTPSPTPLTPNREGIFFEFGRLIFESPYETQVIEGEELVQASGMIERFPNYYQIDLIPENNTIPISHEFSPQIKAYSAREFASLNTAGQIEIDNMKRLIEGSLGLTETEKIPYLPLEGQTRIFFNHLAPIDFDSGTGVRYLTQFGDDGDLFSTNKLIYTFQGLTENQSDYLSFSYPVTINLDELTFEDSEKLAEEPEFETIAQFRAYQRQISSLVESLPPTAFDPPLSEIDRFVNSIFVRLPEPILEFDAAGKVALTLVYPLEGGSGLTGRVLAIEGYTQPGFEEEILISLEVGPNLLFEQQITSLLDGWWRADILVPQNASGVGVLTVRNEGSEFSREIELIHDASILVEEDIFLSMAQPTFGHEAISGYAFFFEGEIINPINNMVTIGLLINDCTNFVARQSFPLLEGQWFGFIIPPEGLVGEACAVAYTGEYGRDNWKEVQVPISLVELENLVEEDQIVIGNSLSTSFKRGGSTFITGVAAAESGQTVEIAVLAAEGELLATAQGTVGEFGFWDIELTIPADAPDLAVLQASVIDAEKEIKESIEIEISD